MTLADASLACLAAATALPVVAAVRIPARELTSPIMYRVMLAAMFALGIGLYLSMLHAFLTRPR